jgi:hypothetical protein
MAILWAGGEDFDFPNGVVAWHVLQSGTFRSAYARCAVWTSSPVGAFVKSTVFPGGGVTSAWLSCIVGKGGINNTELANTFLIGLGKSGTNKGIFIGYTAFGQLTIYSYNGSTSTSLAAEGSLTGYMLGNSFNRLDVQISNFNGTGSVSVYWNGAFVVTYSGSLTISGITDLDSVFFSATNGTGYQQFSEIIVADEDTRAFTGLMTMVPTGAGTTDDWIGAYTDVNEREIDNSTFVYTDTVSQDEQFNLTDLPSGSFGIRAVVATAKVTSTAGATATKVALGFKSGGSVAVGTSQSTTTAWETKHQIFAQNPVTSADWAQSDMNALQIDLRSGS